MANILNLRPEELEPEIEERESAIADTQGPDAMAWEAHHPLPPRATSRRYLLMGALAVVGGVVAWWQASILTAAVVLLGLATWEIRERYARPTSVKLDERGLTIDGDHHPAARLSSFDIHRMPDGTNELSVATESWRARYLRMPLGDQDPDQVRAVLSRVTAEEEHPVPLLDWWLRK